MRFARLKNSIRPGYREMIRGSDGSHQIQAPQPLIPKLDPALEPCARRGPERRPILYYSLGLQSGFDLRHITLQFNNIFIQDPIRLLVEWKLSIIEGIELIDLTGCYATENHSSRLIPASSKIVSSREGSISSP